MKVCDFECLGILHDGLSYFSVSFVPIAATISLLEEGVKGSKDHHHCLLAVMMIEVTLEKSYYYTMVGQV